MKPILPALLVATTLAFGASTAAGSDELETAQAFLEAGLYAEATDYLRIAADQGDAQAAEILGFLYGRGEQSFPGVSQDPVQAARWFDIASRGGDRVGRYMSCALARVSAGRRARECIDAAGAP